ncbi:hypothetical protein Nepgr_027668 [Nepenthes gracilis]|uniref:Uncharacterized protein n=1 Tax=Nepenthes gracilis TaxID=150966 RepID=A0AAD3TA86_NEPGR|nr:hypothetical protein Nepgr_027668 [Nepenthes gracilis]
MLLNPIAKPLDEVVVERMETFDTSNFVLGIASLISSHSDTINEEPKPIVVLTDNHSMQISRVDHGINPAKSNFLGVNPICPREDPDKLHNLNISSLSEDLALRTDSQGKSSECPSSEQHSIELGCCPSGWNTSSSSNYPDSYRKSCNAKWSNIIDTTSGVSLSFPGEDNVVSAEVLLPLEENSLIESSADIKPTILLAEASMGPNFLDTISVIETCGPSSAVDESHLTQEDTIVVERSYTEEKVVGPSSDLTPAPKESSASPIGFNIGIITIGVEGSIRETLMATVSTPSLPQSPRVDRQERELTPSLDPMASSPHQSPSVPRQE